MMTGDFDLLPCGYLSFRDSGVITSCNSTLATWVGSSKEALAGKSIENVLTLATRIFYNTHFFPLIRLHGKANEIYLTLKDKVGNDIPVLVNAARAMEGTEHIIHCVLMRVEERKKYEQELLQAKRNAEQALNENKHLLELTQSLEQHAMELDKQYHRQKMTNENLIQFSKIVSHDLQEPIRKILLFVELISRDSRNVLTEKSKTHCSRIERAAEKLRALTTSLEEYIVIDNDAQATNVNLNTTIDAAKIRAASLRQFSDFGFNRDTLPTIAGYQEQLELLFFHLIDNAIQFRSPSRKLEIAVKHVLLEENAFQVTKDQYKYVEYVRIIIEDNGIGFSDEYREYVFRLFKKLDGATSGLGIGLPLVQKVVHNHSGAIRVSSREDAGTRFEIDLPLKQPFQSA